MTIPHNRVHAPETTQELNAQLYNLFQIHDQRNAPSVERTEGYWKTVRNKVAESMAKRGNPNNLDIEAGLNKQMQRFQNDHNTVK